MHTILVIDDDQKLSRTLVQILRRSGFSVVTTTQLSQARSHLYLHSFDLIIYDSNVPDEADIGLVHELHGLFPDIPIILITDNPIDISALTKQQIGVSCSLVKPVDPANVLACVDEILIRQ